jgi:hypothetical protein
MQDQRPADAAESFPPEDDSPSGATLEAPGGATPAAEQPPDAGTTQPRERPNRADRGGKGGNPRNETLPAAGRVMRKFQACGRCSYFIADCQVKLGREAVSEAAAAAREGWLELACDNDMSRLLHNAYGIETDVSAFYLDGTCPECRRRYTYSDRSAEQQPSLLRIAID